MTNNIHRKKWCAAESELYRSCKMSTLNSLVEAEGGREEHSKGTN
jgi:hypothetical protein